MLAALSFSAEEVINVRGKVTNKDGDPVAGATVTLVRLALTETTGDDGNYAIAKTAVASLPVILPGTEQITLKKGVLELALDKPAPVRIELFDVKGKLLKKITLPDASVGSYRMSIVESMFASKLMVVRASIGQHTMNFRYFPFYRGSYQVQGHAAAGEVSLAKKAAVIDTLKITADTYSEQAISISNYDTTINVTLESEGELCEGCGKTDHPENGKYTIDVDGTEREYLLRLPADYDPGKQYMLIFCPHWMGGNIDQVVSGQLCGGPFYGLEALADGKAIFAVPQGLKSGSSTGFPNTNGRDIAFFRDMLDHFNSTLCIDQKRIFSTGFSYGGMMSFAVGCAMNNLVRAIAPMSGAFYSGCDSSSQGPIAVFQVHGDHDQVVPVANGRAARDYFLAQNECDPSSGSPVEPGPYCVKYDCLEGYPQVYCEFDLEEEPTESRHHGVRSWAAAGIWEFFSQF